MLYLYAAITLKIRFFNCLKIQFQFEAGYTKINLFIKRVNLTEVYIFFKLHCCTFMSFMKEYFHYNDIVRYSLFYVLDQLFLTKRVKID